MEQKHRELLLEDFGSRLYCGVKVTTNNPAVKLGIVSGISIEGKITVSTKHADIVFDVTEVKPYLRPMSSMTEEEDKEWQYYKNKIAESCDELLEDKINQCHDFFNAHHLDFRNLIERGLAIEVTEENNPYKD